MWQRYHITDGKCLHHHWCAICHKKYISNQSGHTLKYTYNILLFSFFFHLISSSCSADNWRQTNKKWKTLPDSKSQQSSKIIMPDFLADFGGGGRDKCWKIVLIGIFEAPYFPYSQIRNCILCVNNFPDSRNDKSSIS